MNTIKEKILNASKQYLNNMIDRETREWPPSCGFVIFQPERPVMKCIATETEGEFENA